MMTEEDHLSPMDLDLIDLGQASPEAVAYAVAHGARCSTCAARRAEHAQHVAYFRTSVFPGTAEVLAARGQGRGRRMLQLRWLFGLALPAAAVLLLVRSQPARMPVRNAETTPPVIGIKGPPLLQVFARRPGPGGAEQVTKVRDGDRLAAGDALRFVLSSTGLPYVLIVSVDGAAQPSVYYPFHGEVSAEIDEKGSVAVPGSIVLDQAPGPERIFVIHSETPIQADTVRDTLVQLGARGADAIRAAQRLPIEGTVQSTLLFEKDSDQ